MGKSQQEKSKDSSVRKLFSRVKLKDVYGWLILFSILWGLSAVIGYRVPQVISALYDNYENEEKFAHILWQGFAIFLLQFLVRAVYQISISYAVKQALGKIRRKLFENWIFSQDKIIGHERTYIAHDKYTRGEFQARLMNDTEAVSDLISSGGLTIFIDFFFVFSSMISFFELHKFYGVSLFIIESILCVLLIRMSRVIAASFKKVRTSTGQLSRMISGLTRGFRQVYYTQHKDFPVKSAQPYLDQFLNYQLKANLWDASYYSFAESLFPALLAMTVLIFPFAELTSVAIFAALVDLIQRSISPIKDIASKISGIQRAGTGINRILELSDDLERYKVHTGQAANLDTQGFRFQCDSFMYDRHGLQEKRAPFELKDISFSMQKGDRLGILGVSGSGKSTILKILSGEICTDQASIVFESKREQIHFNGKELDQLDFLRSQICLISQDSYVFSNSLKFNISFDKNVDAKTFQYFWDATAERIPYLKTWEIKPNDFVDPLHISVGQKQLISALRFCYQKKPIVLFDEISAALDGDLEQALSQFMDIIHSDVMAIIVAHRLETVLKCPRLLFLKDGCQEGFGDHQSLYASNNDYQQLYREWAGHTQN